MKKISATLLLTILLAAAGTYWAHTQRPELLIGLKNKIMPPANTTDMVPAADTQKLGLKGKIVFESNKDGNNEIYLIDFNQNARIFRLTNNKTSDEYPVLSPDGNKIAFVSNVSGRRKIYTMDANGSNVKQLANTDYDEDFPAWGPDGDSVFFNAKTGKNEDIFVHKISTTTTTQLTFDPARQILPAISPDGKTLCFTSNKKMGWQVYSMPATGGPFVRLTKISGNCRPDWAPNGQYLAFVTQRADAKGEIFFMDKNGTNPRPAMQDKANYDYDPSFSPDGKMVVFAKASKKHAPDSWDLWLFDVNTQKQYRLTNSPDNEKFPDWSV